MANAEGGIGWIQGEGLCSQLCASCNITPPLTNDHDIDALISALTAIAPPEEVCSKSDYVELLNRVGKWYEPPKGFRLLKTLPRSITVKEMDFDAWMALQRPRSKAR
jgi:hypothetical protein